MLRVRFKQQNTKPKRQVWIVDLTDLNDIVTVAKAVCLQPDKFNLKLLADTIAKAALDRGILTICAEVKGNTAST